MVHSRVNIAIVGSGPAGLAAAVSASNEGASVLLIERETRIGGKLNQIVDNHFGFIKHDKRLAGPELVFAESSVLQDNSVAILLQTHVLDITRVSSTFHLTLSNRHGIMQVEAEKVILATGAYEQPPRQSAIHGTRPAGVFTAGVAQYYLNVLGQMPGKLAVILGSGNIALNLARRLTLEGATVLGVYEPLSEPQGSLKMVSECLNDFGIPLNLNHTITRTIGTSRLRAVEIYKTNKNGEFIRGTGNAIKCDSLFLSMNLISDTEFAESLGAEMGSGTSEPVCDQNNMTMLDGLFTCGNAAFISSNPCHITLNGENAGLSAARHFPHERNMVKINASKGFLTVFPHYINLSHFRGEVAIYFRAAADSTDKTVRVIADSQEVHSEEFVRLRPQETVHMAVNIGSGLTSGSKVELRLE